MVTLSAFSCFAESVTILKQEKYMNYKVHLIQDILKDCHISRNGKLIFFIIGFHKKDEMPCYISTDLISQYVHLSPSQVNRELSALEYNGYIFISKQDRQRLINYPPENHHQRTTNALNNNSDQLYKQNNSGILKYENTGILKYGNSTNINKKTGEIISSPRFTEPPDLAINEYNHYQKLVKRDQFLWELKYKSNIVATINN